MRASPWIQPAPSLPDAGFNTLISRFAHLMIVLRSEYGRAIAAERRYLELRHRDTPTARTRATSADLPRQVFDEFYARPSDESTRLSEAGLRRDPNFARSVEEPRNGRARRGRQQHFDKMRVLPPWRM
jgi:hypothetical protein